MDENLNAQKARENSNNRAATFTRELRYALYAIEEATARGHRSAQTYVVNAYVREVIAELKNRGFKVNYAWFDTIVIGMPKQTAIKIKW